MTPMDRDFITRECERLVLRAARLTDQAQWAELAELFAEDARLVRPSDPANPLVGRAAILDSMRARRPQTTRHLLTNLVVDVRSASAAHISSTVTLFAGPAPTNGLPVAGQKILVGNFEDDVVLMASGWAFERRDGSVTIEFDCT
jgi:SnoaL-like domain